MEYVLHYPILLLLKIQVFALLLGVLIALKATNIHYVLISRSTKWKRQMTVAMRCEQLRNHSTGAVTERLAAAVAPWPAAPPAPFAPASAQPFVECAQQAFAAQLVQAHSHVQAQAQAQAQVTLLQSSPPPTPIYPYLMPMWPERPSAPPVRFVNARS